MNTIDSLVNLDVLATKMMLEAVEQNEIDEWDEITVVNMWRVLPNTHDWLKQYNLDTKTYAGIVIQAMSHITTPIRP